MSSTLCFVLVSIRILFDILGYGSRSIQKWINKYIITILIQIVSVLRNGETRQTEQFTNWQGKQEKETKSPLKFPNTVSGWPPAEDAQQDLAFHLHLTAVASAILQSKTGFWTNCKTSQMDFWLREVCADIARGCSVKEINYRCLISHLPFSWTALHYCHMANSVLSHGFGTAPASLSVISKCETQ